MSPQLIILFKKLVITGAINQISKGAMPNIPMPTMGGEFFWDNLVSERGWRVQRNTVFGNCRILDPNNVRRAWGSMESMEDLFRRLGKD